jgi:hypothetical protein
VVNCGFIHLIAAIASTCQAPVFPPARGGTLPLRSANYHTAEGVSLRWVPRAERYMHFLEYLAGEEQNVLTTLVNLRADFDVFNHLDVLYRAPLDHLDVPHGEETLPSLYLFVHFHLFHSVACLARAHLSECLASNRKAIDAALSAYEIFLDPATVAQYKAREGRFRFIKRHIAKARKADPSSYPLAAELVTLHEICSEYGSHADISSFIHRVERQELGKPGKSKLLFHYFQFPRDKTEYHAYFVETLLAFYQMLLIFRPFISAKAVGLPTDWEKEIAAIGKAIEGERNAVYEFFKTSGAFADDET